MARKHEEGLRDPFNKWSDATEGLAAANVPLAAAKDMLSQLTRQLASPGLGNPARRALLKAVADTKADIKTYEKQARETVRGVKEQKRIQLDIIYKLNALRSQLNRRDLTPDVLANMVASEKTLGKLLASTKKLDAANIGDVLKGIHEAQKALEKLPDTVHQAFADSEETLQRVLDAQEESREFLRQQRQDIKNLGVKIGKGFLSLGMSLADKIGVGPLTVGNAIRGAAAVGRGAKATWNAGAYVAKTIGAMRTSRKSSKDGEEVSSSSSFIDKFSEYVAHTRLFQRRMMNSAEKRESGPSWLSSLLPSLAGVAGLAGKVAMMFGAGGVIGGLIARFSGTLTSKILPMLGGLLKGGLRVLGPLGALYGAFEAGQWIGKQLNKYVQEPIAKAIDYLFLKNEKGNTGIQQHYSDAKDYVSQKYDQTKKVVSGAYSSAKDSAMSAYSSAKDSAASGYGTIKSAVSNLPSPSQALAATSSAVGGALDKAADAVGLKGGYNTVKSWIGKLFTTGSNVDVDGLNPAMQGNMISMAKEYYEQTGKKLQINSAHRSNEKQAALYKSLGPGKAAPPGRSLHNYGLAFDTQSRQGDELAKMGLLSKYGFDRPVKGEKWHIQPQGMTLSAAKKGVYSADGPANQASSTPVSQAVSATRKGTPSVPAQAVSQGNGQGSGKSKGSAQPSTRVGVNDIPTFDMSDGQFLAMNIGVM